MTLVADGAEGRKKKKNRGYGAEPPPAAMPQPVSEPVAAAPKPRAQKWLQAIAQGLASERALTATKSSFVIAINCLMLAVTAHALFRDGEPGALGLALIPLALTNLLSLLFGVASAEARESPGTLEELWSKKDGEYEPALEALLESKQRLADSFTQELHHHGAALARARGHLHSAYMVLLGGLLLSAVTFALCFALGSRA